MVVIKPSYEIITELNPDEILKRIERAARTCYKSEEKITDGSAERMIVNVLKRGHESVIEHESMSVRFICDRGVSHELVRHRLASFSQESTRYCDYTGDKFGREITFIMPCFLNKHDMEYLLWNNAMVNAEASYFRMIDAGFSAQEARSVLPNSLKTEIVVTANMREWRTIFKLRCDSAAHPQMREIMRPLLDDMKKKIPCLFSDIHYE